MGVKGETKSGGREEVRKREGEGGGKSILMKE